jgi:hypothetical protein
LVFQDLRSQEIFLRGCQHFFVWSSNTLLCMDFRKHR